MAPRRKLTEASDIAALAASDHADPFSILGPHRIGRDIVVRVLMPDAVSVAVAGLDGTRLAELERVPGSDVFHGIVPDAAWPLAYRLQVRRTDGDETLDDPYRFGPWLGELDRHLLGEGNHLRAYEKMGAHVVTHEGIDGTAFAVWAPNARRVSVVGDFNRWDGRRHPMRLHPGIGIWEIFVPGVGPGHRYKYEIRGRDGNLLPLKADPYGTRSELRPSTASVVDDPAPLPWSDEAFMARRAAMHAVDAPISIYEVHAGSWARVPEDGNRMLSWDELGERLVAYARDMGFTHIELLPVSEHPFDGSWGYQPIGLFAPTARHGDPAGFARFVDRAHAAGLGVLIDWVPGHFPTDTHGLGEFDGTHLYEHADPRQGFHQDWNTLIYNFGRREVANYLIGNALYWLDRFHLDGLRVDAVASMLYLDYSRKEGEWIPNAYGGRENIEAIEFLRRTNIEVFGRFPGATTVAEESTAWPAVSRPVYLGGLGFGFKWNMGWMNDTLRYIGRDPVHRSWHHADLTFGLLYAFSENFVLPISHDEVVHGKGSMIDRMPGDRWQKFANLRAYYGFMWTHPGKKLLFMGSEFGQSAEWAHDRSLDWHLTQYPEHAGVQNLVRDLNRLYRETPALHRKDCDHAGFEWVEGSDNRNSVLAYLRRGADGDPPVLVVVNFTPTPREGYRVGVPLAGRWTERLNTDSAHYSGSGLGNAGGVDAEPVPWHGRPFSLSLTLPPLAAVILQASGV